MDLRMTKHKLILITASSWSTAGGGETVRERVNAHLLLFTNQLFLQRGDEDELDDWVSVVKMQAPDGGTQSQSPRALTGIPITNLHNH